MKLTSRTVRTTLRNDDYITRDHRVHGVSVLPGVTFIDLVYRMFGVAESIGRLELRNLVFTEPVVTSDQFDQQLEITTVQEAGGWMARLRSTRIKDGMLLGNPRRDIFRCELHVGSDGARPARAVAPLIESASQVTDIAELYAGARRLGIEHREFMTSSGRIHEGDTFALAEVRLGALAKRLSNQFCIHPVFMDVATGVPQFVRRRSQHAPEKPYIPIFIESVRAWQPLTDPCFIYVDKHADDSRSADLISADVAIYDAAGNLAVDMRRLTLKRVRAERLIIDLVGAAAPAPRPQAAATAPAPVEAEPSMAEPGDPAAAQLEARVTAGLQALAVSALQKPVVDPAVGFYEQGFESTDLLGFVRALEDALGLQLYPTLLFEYPTVRDLARFLIREHPSSPGALAPAPRVTATTAGAGSTTRADVVRALRGLISAVTGRDADTIPVDTSFYDLGLDSAHLTGLVGSLESKLGRRLYPTLLFEYTTIHDLAGHLHTEYGHLFSDDGGAQADPRPPAGRSSSAADGALTVYVPERVEYDAAADRPARPVASPAGTLFVFDTDARLAKALRRRGAARDRRRVILVKPGEDFRTVSPDLVELRSDRRADYDRLFATGEADATPQTIVYAWTLADAAPAEGDAGARLESATRRIDLGIRGILLLLQAAAARGGRTRANVVVLAPAACGPETRALGALFRTISSESPSIVCRLVTATPDRLDADALASIVDDELAGGPTASYEVEHGAGGPFTERLRAAVTPAGEGPTQLRRGGTYVITGGAGGLGRVVADHLARNYQANVVLIGRSLASERTGRQLEAWRQLGCQARYVRADVCDYEAMRAAFDEIRREIGPVTGVVHCAGVIDDALFVNKQQASLSRVLAPKVYGTIVLDYVSRAEPLDFFATFSSASALFGNPGHGDYAFANAFMDGYAEERESLRRQGARHGVSVSIAWPLWDAEGMAQTAPQQVTALSKHGLMPLPPQIGCQAFERVLAAGVQRALVLYGDERTIEETLGRQGRLSQPARTPIQVDVRQAAANAPLRTAPARASADATRAETADLIAVVGLAGQYPGCANLDELWLALADGRDFVTEIPVHRWDYRQYFHPERGRPGCSYSKWGSFLEDYDKFDPLFFNLSPRDAEMMDPQERLFLETSWAAIEDAGYTPDTLAPTQNGGRDVGVFAGVMWSDYQLCGFEQGLKGSPGVAGSWFSMIPNRVSYLLNFNGPSLPVDTACSSSLLAVHLACESLKRGECAVALAGGVNLSLHPHKYVTTSQLAMFSSEGRCRSFGEGGDGYVPGEGVGVVVLKPLTRALQDGDHVYGVIRGTASRHGGRTSGFAVPSPAAQAALIAANLQQSGTDARTITCVEAHGTGTALGDPIEVRGLSDAFGRFTKDHQFCSLGSVKSNLGHLESAAGIVALTKVLLQLQHEQLAPTLHASTPNRHIDFEHSPFVLQHTLGPWQRPVLTIDGREQEAPRRAAISSFGAGGVNAHVIVEEHESGRRGRDVATGPLLFLLSARSGERLKAYGRRVKAHLESTSRPGSASAPLADVAYTLQVGRVALEERAAFIASTAAELLHKLDAWLHGRAEAGIHTGNMKAAAGVADVLSGGSEARQFVASLIGSRQLTSLARLWVNGVPIDWTLLYGGDRPRRCALPTYPFARERYWVGTPAGEVARHDEPYAAPIERCEPADTGAPAPAPTIAPESIDATPVDPGVADADTLREFCEDYLKTIIAAELKLSPSRIDVTEPVLNYGLDSVVMMKLRAALEDTYGELPVMLLFDYNTVRALAAHLVESYPGQTSAMMAGVFAETAT